MKVVYITDKPDTDVQDKAKQPNSVYRMPDIPELSGSGYTFIKNSAKDLNGHLVRGEYCDPYEAVDVIDGGCASESINASGAGCKSKDGKYAFCLDTGSLNVCSRDPREFISILGDRIRAVILRDNDGCNDKALIPFSSISSGGLRFDWKGVILGLREINFDGILILDCSDSVSVLQPGIKKEFLPYVHKMGEYFKWQICIDRMVRSYDKCVLFGAGRMCRNYLKAYKDICPPLFTCDNNESLWGTDVDGLKVHSPKELRRVPADVPILICNMYYDEIAEELKKMGLPNRIEFFSDEWMDT